jgi:AraC-like DNA-binding protein
MHGLVQGLLDGFRTFEVRAGDLDSLGRYRRPNGPWKGAFLYRPRSGRAARTQNDVLGVHAWRGGGGLWPGYTANQIDLEMEVAGDGSPCYGLYTALSGALEATGPDGKGEAHGARGMILRGSPGTKFRTSDSSMRLIIWMDTVRLERTLQARIGEPLREMLAFAPDTDWSSGQGRVVWRMITRLLEETRDPDGLTGDPIARETFTDLFMQTVLSRLRHNYTARLVRPPGAAIPRHVRLAEAFMHASADRPITMADVSDAAGCATATLYAAFRRFRSITPLAALHRIRLQRVRDILRETGDEVSTHTIARRFGFTNPSRFLAAYGSQFGEHPNEVRRRG